MTFIQIDDDTHIALAVIRSITRRGNKVKVEFTDGTVRDYAAKLDAFNHVDDLVGQIVSAAPGWQVASYCPTIGKATYQGVIAFRIKPGAMPEPITHNNWIPGLAALVDPHGCITDLDELLSYDDVEEFVKQAQERLHGSADDEAAQ